MNKKLLTCLSLILTTAFIGACDGDLEKAPLSEILVTHSEALVTKESGESATFLMTLSEDPGREVVISILSSDLSEGIVEPSVVILDASNWFVPISFTITGLQDGIVDGDIDYKITLAEETDAVVAHPLEAVELDVKNLDIDHAVVPDPASFELSSTQLLTREGGPAMDFSLVLGSKPTADVIVTLQVSDESEGSLSQNSLSFSPENWQEVQIVKVNPLADGIVDGDQDYFIAFGVSSTDERYDGYEIAALKVKNIDVDELIPPSFKLSTRELLTREGGPAVDFSLVLGSKPTADVIVTLQASDDSEGSLSQNSLSFSTENWQVAQIVKVHPLTDGIVDGDQDYVIAFSVLSADERYNAYEIAAINVKNTDVDVPVAASFKLSATELLTHEDGAAVDFSLALGSKPTSDVVVALHASDESEGSLSQSSLSFSVDNWEQAQIVTVTPKTDGIVDGDQNYVVEFAVSSTDKRYDAYKIAAVKIKNIDVDLPPASFKLSTTKLLTREGGRTVNFSLVLGSKPTSDVLVALHVSDESEGSVNISTLSFNSYNWQQAQIVTVTPLADGIVDGDQEYVIAFDVSSSDERYNAFEIAPINVKNINVDYEPGTALAIRVVAGNITSGSGQSYDEGHGIRIFQALNADIVMIQEFNMKSKPISTMVADTFGPEFYYTIGKGTIPNGIVSRFPIIESGAWASNVTTNRDWDWAVVDLPGPRDVLVVSVHLNTERNGEEMEPLKVKIQAKVDEGGYYVLLGGDFNTPSRGRVEIVFPPVLKVEGPYPVDQNNVGGTNKNRKSPYDWVLCCSAWSEFEVPVIIGSRAYPNGHVFDSRVYSSLGELGDVEPVLWNDSGSSGMQHMAVVRDFVFRY